MGAKGAGLIPRLSSLASFRGATARWKLDCQSGSFSFHNSNNLTYQPYFDVITRLDDFLHCFHGNQQKRATDYLKSLKNTTNAVPFRTTMSFDGEYLLYSVLTAKYESKDTIAGELTFLFSLPQRHYISNILLSLFDNKHYGLVITDKNSVILACNEQLEINLGYRLHELIGQKTSLFKSGKLEEHFYNDLWVSVGFNEYWCGKILSKRKDGVVIPQELTIQTLNFDPTSTYYIGILKSLKDKPHLLAGVERGGVELLTQLPNERHFKQLLSKRINELTAEQSMFTIVWQPNIADSHSQKYCEMLSKVFSAEAHAVLCGYLGENRFIIAYSCRQDDLKNKAKLVVKLLKPLVVTLKGCLCRLCFKGIRETSFGVSVLDDDASTASELFEHAMIAMEEKHGGPARRFCFFDHKERQNNQRKARLTSLVRDAVLSDEVEVYYQPIINTATWSVCNLEALCRFRGIDGELLDTEEVVSIVEEMGLSEKLDLSIAKKAIAEIPILQSKYGSDVGLNLNISLKHPSESTQSLYELIDILKAHAHQYSNISVEIKESTYFDRQLLNHDFLKFIKNNNVNIAIDDFGRGYSSLAYLRESVFDVLKIDKGLVTRIEENSRNYHIVNMVVRLAKVLGVKTVAEGVESYRVATMLHSMGVDMLQGYLFSVPLPACELKGMNSTVYQLKKAISDNGVPSLFSECVILMPDSSLADIRQIFESSSCDVLPVTYEKRCVGFIDRSRYHLHISATLGTAIENIRDTQALHKTANQIMNSCFSVVEGELTNQKVLQLVQQKLPFPWVVQSPDGRFVGLIEQSSVLHFLAKF